MHPAPAPTRSKSLVLAVLATIMAFAAASAVAGEAHAELPSTGFFNVIDNGFETVPAGDPFNELDLATGGTVTFSYSNGFGFHNVSFGDGPAPTECIQTSGEGGGPVPPLPATAAMPTWSGECTFETPGTYGFFCELHGSASGGEVFGMAGYVHVADEAPADTEPPVTTATVDPDEPDGPDGTYLGPVTITLEADDGEDGSGVNRTEYRLDDPEGDWVEYTAPVVVGGSGSHLFEYRSADNEGNVEAVQSIGFEIADEPVANFNASDNVFTLQGGNGNQLTIYTGETVGFAYPSGSNPHNLSFGGGPQPAGCFQTAGDVTGAVPPLPSSPQGAGWAGRCTFDQPVVHRFFCTLHGTPTSGMHGVVNVIETLEDDETPPVTEHALSPGTPNGPGGAYTGTVTVTLNASDPGGEGVERTELRLNDPEGEFVEYTAPVPVSGVGSHTLEYRSVDLAGNVEESKSVSFQIVQPVARVARLSMTVKPRRVNLGARKKNTSFRLNIRNRGNGSSARIRVCAQAPRNRLRTTGGRCRNVAPIRAGGQRSVRFKLRVRPRAVGKTTRVKFRTSGPRAPKNLTVRVKVRKAG